MKGTSSFLVVAAMALATVGCRGPSGSISPDGKRVAWSGPKGFVVQPADRSRAGVKLGSVDVGSVTWSPDGRWLLCDQAPAGADPKTGSTVTLFDTSSWKQRRLPAALQSPFAWSPDGKSVYAARISRQKKWDIVRFDRASGEVRDHWPVTAQPKAIVASEDRFAAIVGSGVTIVRQGRRRDVRVPDAESIAFDRNGNTWVASTRTRDPDRLASDTEVSRVTPDGSVESLVASTDTASLMSDSGRFVFANGASLSPDGQRLLLSGEEDASPSGVMDAYLEYLKRRTGSEDTRIATAALEDQIGLRQLIVGIDLASGVRTVYHRGPARAEVDLSVDISWTADGRRACLTYLDGFRVIDVGRSAASSP